MVADPLIPLAEVDHASEVFDLDAIRQVNRQRHEMEQLSGVVLFDTDRGVIAGYRDITEHEFWVRGHIPGRPLMPGVLMIEAAAQLCSFYYAKSDVAGPGRFIGFGGVDGIKFRGTVVPGDRFLILAKSVELKSRRAVFDTQGFVAGKMVFQARIIGMPI